MPEETAKAETFHNPLHVNWKKVVTVSIIAGVVFLLVYSVAVYYVLNLANQAITSNKQTTPSATKSATATSSAKKDETADWSTIKKDFFSFKYPPNWEDTTSNSSKPGSYIVRLKTNPMTYISAEIATDINSTDTPENLAKQAQPNAAKKNILVDGHKAIYQETTSHGTTQFYVYVGDVKSTTNFAAQDGGPKLTTGTYRIFSQTNEQKDLNSIRETFNEIISTFKFF